MSTPDFSGFSCPQFDLDQELLEVIVGDHAAEVVATLLDRHGNELGHGAPGVPGLLKAWLGRADEARFETVWNPVFGDVRALLLSQSHSDLLRCAAALALRLNECGQAGQWRALLPAPATLRFGPWVLPAASAIDVDASATRVALRFRADDQWHTLAFERAPDASWVATEAPPSHVFARCGHPGFGFRLASDKALSEPAAGRLLNADAYHFEPDETAINQPWVATCNAALDLIVAASPQYVTWINRVLRDLIPLKARPSVFNSGSEQYSPGVICVCDHPYRWPLAEMLVHEASHQYLHILNRLGPLDDGSDTGMHFSPFRNKDRPIFFIVVAYHAFANVLLFYRGARERGLVPDTVSMSEAFAHRERTLEHQLRQIEQPLLQSRALTPLGRSLWEPLYHALQR